MIFIKDLQVLTFTVSFNSPSSLNMHGCRCPVCFSGFVGIGHLSSLLQGSPNMKLPALLIPWTLLYMSAPAPWFLTWKEWSPSPRTHTSPSLSRDCLVYYAFSVGGIVPKVLFLLFLLMTPPSVWIEILILTGWNSRILRDLSNKSEWLYYQSC